MRRTLSSAVLAVFAAVATVLLVASPAQALSAEESDFTSRLNAERSASGLSRYAVRDDLTAVARRQAQRMATRGGIYHNPNLENEVDNWQSVGENVGRGPDVASVHQALMQSPTHRANILDRDFTEVGMGTVRAADGYLYVAQVFRKPLRAAATTTVSAPKPAPAKVTTTAVRKATVRPARVAAVTKPVVRSVDPAAALRSRLETARQAARTSHGALDSAVSYLDLMSAL